jgi:hypothetical protein
MGKEKVKVALGITLTILLVCVLLSPIGRGAMSVPVPIIRILDVRTDLNSTSVYVPKPIPPKGIPFSVNIYLSGAMQNLANYQVAVIFNKTLVRATSVSFPANDLSFVFYGKDFYSISSIDNNGTPAVSPMAIGGAALKDLTHPVNVQNGILCTMNFTTTEPGNSTLSVYEPYFNLTNVYTIFLIMINGVPISEVPYTSESFLLTVAEFGVRITYLISLFQTTPTCPNWDANADLNKDGIVNIRDITIAVLNSYET